MKSLKTIVGSLTLMALFGCGNPADKVPEASVKPANKPSTSEAPSTAAKAPEADGTSFAFGPENSKIDFIGSKVTGSHNGGFKNFTGELKVVDGKLVDAGNKVVIDIASLWADNDRLTGHLKSPDFFDAARFPTATFVTTQVKEAGTNSNVTGDLTLHGITKSISFPADIAVIANSASLSSQFFLNRFDFEIKYNKGKADDLIRKEVVLKLDIKAAPGKAKFETIEPAPKTASVSAPIRNQ